MAKQIIMYPKLRRYLQNIKKEKKFQYKDIASQMKLHQNVIHTWFWGYRFPRASNILPLSRCLSKTEEQAKIIALDILEIADNE